VATATANMSHDDLYKAKAGTPALVEVPPARFLMIDGQGSPDGEEFQQAIGALYAIAYTSKFALKKAKGPDVKVPPLEGLFDVLREPAKAFDPAVRERLRWTLMLRVPEPIDDELIERAREDAARKKDMEALARVRIEEFNEGACAQVLHIGPYSEEPTTIELLRGFIDDQGRAARRRHHEIYLSVPGRTKPERLKTILRQPVS
jgi:hypothetical protein